MPVGLKEFLMHFICRNSSIGYNINCNAFPLINLTSIKIPIEFPQTHGDSSQSPYPSHIHTHGNPHGNSHTHGSPGIVAKRLDGLGCHLVWWYASAYGHLVLDGDPVPPKREAQQPPIFGPRLSWPNGWMDQDATWYGGRPRPKPRCVRWGPSSPTERGGRQAHLHPRTSSLVKF